VLLEGRGEEGQAKGSSEGSISGSGRGEEEEDKEAAADGEDGRGACEAATAQVVKDENRRTGAAAARVGTGAASTQQHRQLVVTAEATTPENTRDWMSAMAVAATATRRPRGAMRAKVRCNELSMVAMEVGRVG
jgi:hypothetical protein